MGDGSPSYFLSDSPQSRAPSAPPPRYRGDKVAGDKFGSGFRLGAGSESGRFERERREAKARADESEKERKIQELREVIEKQKEQLEDLELHIAVHNDQLAMSAVTADSGKSKKSWWGGKKKVKFPPAQPALLIDTGGGHGGQAGSGMTVLDGGASAPGKSGAGKGKGKGKGKEGGMEDAGMMVRASHLQDLSRKYQEQAKVANDRIVELERIKAKSEAELDLLERERLSLSERLGRTEAALQAVKADARSNSDKMLSAANAGPHLVVTGKGVSETDQLRALLQIQEAALRKESILRESLQRELRAISEQFEGGNETRDTKDRRERRGRMGVGGDEGSPHGAGHRHYGLRSQWESDRERLREMEEGMAGLERRYWNKCEEVKSLALNVRESSMRQQFLLKELNHAQSALKDALQFLQMKNGKQAAREASLAEIVTATVVENEELRGELAERMAQSRIDTKQLIGEVRSLRQGRVARFGGDDPTALVYPSDPPNAGVPTALPVRRAEHAVKGRDSNDGGDEGAETASQGDSTRDMLGSGDESDDTTLSKDRDPQAYYYEWTGGQYVLKKGTPPEGPNAVSSNIGNSKIESAAAAARSTHTANAAKGGVGGSGGGVRGTGTGTEPVHINTHGYVALGAPCTSEKDQLIAMTALRAWNEFNNLPPPAQHSSLAMAPGHSRRSHSYAHQHRAPHRHTPPYLDSGSYNDDDTLGSSARGAQRVKGNGPTRPLSLPPSDSFRYSLTDPYSDRHRDRQRSPQGTQQRDERREREERDEGFRRERERQRDRDEAENSRSPSAAVFASLIDEQERLSLTKIREAEAELQSSGRSKLSSEQNRMGGRDAYALTTLDREKEREKERRREREREREREAAKKLELEKNRRKERQEKAAKDAFTLNTSSSASLASFPSRPLSTSSSSDSSSSASSSISSTGSESDSEPEPEPEPEPGKSKERGRDQVKKVRAKSSLKAEVDSAVEHATKSPQSSLRPSSQPSPRGSPRSALKSDLLARFENKKPADAADSGGRGVGDRLQVESGFGPIFESKPESGSGQTVRIISPASSGRPSKREASLSPSRSPPASPPKITQVRSPLNLKELQQRALAEAASADAQAPRSPPASRSSPPSNADALASDDVVHSEHWTDDDASLVSFRPQKTSPRRSTPTATSNPPSPRIQASPQVTLGAPQGQSDESLPLGGPNPVPSPMKGAQTGHFGSANGLTESVDKSEDASADSNDGAKFSFAAFANRDDAGPTNGLPAPAPVNLESLESLGSIGSLSDNQRVPSPTQPPLQSPHQSPTTAQAKAPPSPTSPGSPGSPFDDLFGRRRSSDREGPGAGSGSAGLRQRPSKNADSDDSDGIFVGAFGGRSPPSPIPRVNVASATPPANPLRLGSQSSGDSRNLKGSSLKRLGSPPNRLNLENSSEDAPNSPGLKIGRTSTPPSRLIVNDLR